MTLTVDALPNATSGQSGYYFYRAGDEANHNSGWIQTNSWQDTNFLCNTNYTWYVKYRNGDRTETIATSVTSNNSTGYPYSCGATFTPAPSTTTGQVTVSPNQPSTTIKYFDPVDKSIYGVDSKQTFTKVEIPAQATEGTATVKVEPKTISQINQTTNNISLPAGRQIISNLVADYQITSEGKKVESFKKPVTIIFQYKQEDVAKYKEETLKIYYFDEKTKTWSPLADSQVNINTNIITATTTHFTLFAVMGLPKGVQEEKEAPIKPESAKEPEKTNEGVSEEKPKEQSKQTSIQPETKEPAESEAYIFNREMRYGTKGKDVVKLQDLLKALNLLPQDIPCTGYFSVATLKAVNRYQKEIMKIKPCNCGVGPQTRIFLNQHRVATTPEKYVFTQDLSYNDQGEEVRQLQIKLKQEQFFPHWIKNTGWFGPITEKAVKLFQKFYQILEDGIVGPKTREVLNK